MIPDLLSTISLTPEEAENQGYIPGWKLEEGAIYQSTFKNRLYKLERGRLWYRQPDETEWTMCVRSMARFKIVGLIDRD